MVSFSGSLMLLKIAANDNDLSKYLIVGGMRTTRFLLNNQLVDISHKESGKWRQLLGNVGLKSLSISGSGIFTDNSSEKLLREKAFNNLITNFAISFANGDMLIGPFIISTYERSGNVGEEENYNLTLESAGQIEYLGSETYGK